MPSKIEQDPIRKLSNASPAQNISDNSPLKRIKKGPVQLDSGAVYEGEWLNDKRDGKGILIQMDGSRFEGDFSDDMCHGKGTLNYANGDSYSGDWVCDRKHG